MNYYKRYMGDYAKMTAALTLAQHGAYSLLLDHYYATEKALPDDMDALYRVCRAFDKREREAVAAVADMFFPVGDDGMRHNKKADSEIPSARAAMESAQTNGKKGGRPIKKVEDQNPEQNQKQGENQAEIEGAAKPSGLSKQNPSGFDNETGSKPAAKTPHTPYTIEARARSKSLAQQAARFDEFWAAYPNRKGKKAALAKWKARNLDAMADTIIADVQARKARDREWLDGYVPHGSTYINGCGWEDDIPQAKQANGSGYQPMAGER